jgi:hypothetical protein
MKKILVAAVVLSVSMLSGCISNATIQKMSEDCAKVGGTMEFTGGLFGPKGECRPPEKE